MGVFEKLLEKIVDMKQVKSSWYFEQLAQFCQANHFMTGWGLGVKEMRNMDRAEITHWWDRCQQSFQSSLIKRMTCYNDKQCFLPLLPAQVEVLKRVQMIDNIKHDRRIVTHRMRPKFVKRRKPTHTVLRNGREMEVV